MASVKKKKPSRQVPTSFYLDPETVEGIATIQERLGLSKSAALRVIVRDALLATDEDEHRARLREAVAKLNELAGFSKPKH